MHVIIHSYSPRLLFINLKDRDLHHKQLEARELQVVKKSSRSNVINFHNNTFPKTWIILLLDQAKSLIIVGGNYNNNNIIIIEDYTIIIF